MITETVAINGQDWIVQGDDRPNPLAPTPRIIATTDNAAVDVNCQHRQITSVSHAAGCSWGVDLSPVCTCAPRLADPTPLFDIARSVLLRCFAARSAAEAAAVSARIAREAADDVWVRLPQGCEGCPSALNGGNCTCC